ncbi:MAG: hypothetical protein WA970_02170, partial [Gammaproteobacteria bacterium]
VVYDSVGKTTFDKSLNCLARGGYLVLYGEASGPVPPVEPWRAYSARKLPLIPRQSCHRFHANPATDSIRKLPAIPRQSCH